MRYPQLDDRLQAAADLFPVCAYGADIGADHGRLSCHLLHSGKCARMIVSDISAESLAKAQALLALHELADRADFCVADGLNALRGRPNVQCAVLVLSSHTDIPLVRQTLMQIGYAITAERIVRAKGRFYVLMRAEPGNAHYTERELYLGPALLDNPPPLWQNYLRWREGVVACEAGHERQLAWIREELAK